MPIGNGGPRSQGFTAPYPIRPIEEIDEVHGRGSAIEHGHASTARGDQEPVARLASAQVGPCPGKVGIDAPHGPAFAATHRPFFPMGHLDDRATPSGQQSANRRLGLVVFAQGAGIVHTDLHPCETRSIQTESPGVENLPNRAYL